MLEKISTHPYIDLYDIQKTMDLVQLLCLHTLLILKK